MAKLTLTDLGTTLSNTAANTINNNGTLIESAMENTLSRDGTSPNQMESDFDLNSHNLVNAESLNANRLFLQGAEVIPSALVNTGEFATDEQGAKADTALQPGNIGSTVQAYDVDLQAIAGLTSSANQMPYSTGTGTWAMTPLTSFARDLIDDGDATTARTTLGVAIGTNVQAFDADLSAIGALVSAADQVPYATGAGTWALTTMTTQARTFNALTALTGTYTPTLTNTTNIAASTPYVCQWMRVNNIVFVSGKVDIDVTAAGNALMGMSLPVASALTTDIQLAGNFTSNAAATPETGCCFADGTNDRASFKFIAANTANNTFFFTFMYQVL